VFVLCFFLFCVPFLDRRQRPEEEEEEEEEEDERENCSRALISKSSVGKQIFVSSFCFCFYLELFKPKEIRNSLRKKSKEKKRKWIGKLWGRGGK